LNRVLAGVAVGLFVALAAIGVLAGEDEGSPPAKVSRGPSVQEVARRVERIRKLRFDHLPRVREVSAAEARRIGLRELDRQLPRGRQAVEERLLELLGLLPPSARLREVLGEVLAGEVGGYYIPRTDTLALVRGSGVGAFANVALAHELTHALEDQHFGIDQPAGRSALDDRVVARSSLHEGTATIAMVDYVVLTQGGGQELPAGVRGEVLDALEGLALPASSGLPRYFREALVFPYSAGAAFVDGIEAEADWAAVDRVFREGGPLSTEQVMHPEKYVAGEKPTAVRLAPYRDALPAGSRAVSGGDLGEFDTAQFLRTGNGRGRAESAAAGWGGSAFRLWRLANGSDVLVMGWTWDTPRDAAEFAEAAKRTLAALETPGALERGKRSIAVVLAPSIALARRIARLAAG
jgi:hypothetical protein